MVRGSVRFYAGGLVHQHPSQIPLELIAGPGFVAIGIWSITSHFLQPAQGTVGVLLLRQVSAGQQNRSGKTAPRNWLLKLINLPLG